MKDSFYVATVVVYLFINESLKSQLEEQSDVPASHLNSGILIIAFTQPLTAIAPPQSGKIERSARKRTGVEYSCGENKDQKQPQKASKKTKDKNKRSGRKEKEQTTPENGLVNEDVDHNEWVKANPKGPKTEAAAWTGWERHQSPEAHQRRVSAQQREGQL